MILEKRFEYLWNIYKHENKKNPMPPMSLEQFIEAIFTILEEGVRENNLNIEIYRSNKTIGDEEDVKTNL